MQKRRKGRPATVSNPWAPARGARQYRHGRFRPPAVEGGPIPVYPGVGAPVSLSAGTDHIYTPISAIVGLRKLLGQLSALPRNFYHRAEGVPLPTLVTPAMGRMSSGRMWLLPLRCILVPRSLRFRSSFSSVWRWSWSSSVRGAFVCPRCWFALGVGSVLRFWRCFGRLRMRVYRLVRPWFSVARRLAQSRLGQKRCVRMARLPYLFGLPRIPNVHSGR